MTIAITSIDRENPRRLAVLATLIVARNRIRLLARCVAGCAIAAAAVANGSSAAPAKCPAPMICRPGVLRAGSYRVHNWIPGMTLRVPAGGWQSTEDSTGEFNLHPPGHPDASIFFWLDPYAVHLDDSRVAGVSTTPKALLQWLRSNRDVIVSKPHARELANGKIHATSVDLDVARTAPGGPPMCPGPCIDYFVIRFPGGQFPYGTGRGELTRLYFARIGSGASKRTLVISIDTPNKAVFKALTKQATEILMSVRLPPKLPPRPR